MILPVCLELLSVEHLNIKGTELLNGGKNVVGRACRALIETD